MHVADILKTKGDAVHTVQPDQNIEHLVHRLRIEGVGAMIVSADGDAVDGIISERDVVLGLTEHGTDTLKMSIADLMTRAVVTCSPADTVAHVARVMTQRRIRHLPVVEGRRLVGIVSVGDVVKQRMDELELETNVLRDYAVSRQH
jgi:CBS domain-containing protein